MVLELTETHGAARIFERQRNHVVGFYARQRRPKTHSLGFRESDAPRRRSIGHCARAHVNALRRPASAAASCRVPATSSRAVPSQARPSSAAAKSSTSSVRQAWSTPVLAVKAAAEQQQHQSQRRALLESFAARLSWQRPTRQVSTVAAPTCGDSQPAEPAISPQVTLEAAESGKKGELHHGTASRHSRCCTACERRQLMSDLALAVRQNGKQQSKRMPASLLDGLGFVASQHSMVEQAPSPLASSHPDSPASAPQADMAPPPVRSDLARSTLSVGHWSLLRKRTIRQSSRSVRLAEVEDIVQGQEDVENSDTVESPSARVAARRDTVTFVPMSPAHDPNAASQAVEPPPETPLRLRSSDASEPAPLASETSSESSDRSESRRGESHRGSLGESHRGSLGSDDEGKNISVLWQTAVALRVQRLWRERVENKKRQQRQQGALEALASLPVSPQALLAGHLGARALQPAMPQREISSEHKFFKPFVTSKEAEQPSHFETLEALERQMATEESEKKLATAASEKQEPATNPEAPLSLRELADEQHEGDSVADIAYREAVQQEWKALSGCAIESRKGVHPGEILSGYSESIRSSLPSECYSQPTESRRGSRDLQEAVGQQPLSHASVCRHLDSITSGSPSSEAGPGRDDTDLSDAQAAAGAGGDTGDQEKFASGAAAEAHTSKSSELPTPHSQEDPTPLEEQYSEKFEEQYSDAFEDASPKSEGASGESQERSPQEDRYSEAFEDASPKSENASGESEDPSRESEDSSKAGAERTERAVADLQSVIRQGGSELSTLLAAQADRLANEAAEEEEEAAAAADAKTQAAEERAAAVEEEHQAPRVQMAIADLQKEIMHGGSDLSLLLKLQADAPDAAATSSEQAVAPDAAAGSSGQDEEASRAQRAVADLQREIMQGGEGLSQLLEPQRAVADLQKEIMNGGSRLSVLLKYQAAKLPEVALEAEEKPAAESKAQASREESALADLQKHIMQGGPELPLLLKSKAAEGEHEALEKQSMMPEPAEQEQQGEVAEEHWAGETPEEELKVCEAEQEQDAHEAAEEETSKEKEAEEATGAANLVEQDSIEKSAATYSELDEDVEDEPFEDEEEPLADDAEEEVPRTEKEELSDDVEEEPLQDDQERLAEDAEEEPFEDEEEALVYHAEEEPLQDEEDELAIAVDEEVQSEQKELVDHEEAVQGAASDKSDGTYSDLPDESGESLKAQDEDTAAEGGVLREEDNEELKSEQRSAEDNDWEGLEGLSAHSEKSLENVSSRAADVEKELLHRYDAALPTSPEDQSDEDEDEELLYTYDAEFDAPLEDESDEEDEEDDGEEVEESNEVPQRSEPGLSGTALEDGTFLSESSGDEGLSASLQTLTATKTTCNELGLDSDASDDEDVLS